MKFEDLELAPELLEAVRTCGYTTPTPIQEQAIPYLLAGRDLMGCAQTGTGKTAAFALPILHQLRGTKPGTLRALVLVPTRELAIQVGKNVAEYSIGLGLRTTAVYGGVPIEPQEMMLRHGVDILVATPGRLKDHIWRGLIDFGETRFLVLDEADRMLDMGFIDAVREIVELIPVERQTMLFSATLENEIRRLARDILRDPVRVEVAPSATVADGIEHVIVPVKAGDKKGALIQLLRDKTMDRALIFTRTRRGAHQLAVHLGRQGHRASSIHSDKSQSERIAALAAFSGGRVRILVATDIAARGLDVTGISHVINYDVPHHAEDYVHRIGRTARAGRTGVAISLVTPEDQACVRSIEQLIGRTLAGGAKVARPAEQLPAEAQPAMAGVRSGGNGNGRLEGAAPRTRRRRSRRPREADPGARDSGPDQRSPRDRDSQRPAPRDRGPERTAPRSRSSERQAPRERRTEPRVDRGERRAPRTRVEPMRGPIPVKKEGPLLQRVLSRLGLTSSR
jgi:ATP-dependent RNA helicase RhlE